MENTNTQPKSYWIGKKAKIEIVKDNQRLTYTADIIEYDSKIITFIDRAGIVYSFNVDMLREIKGV